MNNYDNQNYVQSVQKSILKGMTQKARTEELEATTKTLAISQ